MLEKLAELLGATGLVLGIFYLLYKQVIAKVKLPGLTRQQAFRLLVITLLLVWSVAIIVILTGGGGFQSGGININNVNGSVSVD